MAGVAVLSPLGMQSAEAACTINVTGNSGAVTNSAAINCININNANVAGNVTNTGTGTINTPTTTGIGINNSTITGAIVNNGSITASFDDGIGAFNHSAILGGISNSGQIVANAIGIDISAASTIGGGITNSGTISATLNAGIDISSVSVFSGGFTNSGHIVAKESGVDLSNIGTFSGGVTNTGTISSSNNDALDIGGGTVFSGGVINSGAIVAKFSAIDITVSTFGGGITNSGTLSSSNGAGIDEAASFFSGGISNSGQITGVDGIAVDDAITFSGGISNSGTISAGQQGIDLDGLSTFSGGIANSGAISSQHTAIEVFQVSSFLGGITNSGTISVAGLGIGVGQGSFFGGGITNTGTISARLDDGIDVSSVSVFSGGITNGGTISAGAKGIAVTNVLQFGTASAGGGIVNSGAISAANTAISVGNTTTFFGGITNSGTISSAGNGGIGVNNVSVFSGGISNLGVIKANFSAIGVSGVSTFTGGITNSGTLSAGQYGIFNTGVAILGGITNTGTIIGNIGIEENSSSPAVNIFDSGTITGTGGTAIMMKFTSPGNTLTLGPGYKINGNVLGFGSDTFQLGGSGNGAFDLSTLGVLGSGQQYQGFTTFNVVGGIWTVSNAFGQSQAWNINGGTLAGTGTLKSVNVNAGGTLEPGTPGSPGTFMTINGNLAFQSGAMYLVNIGPNSASRANVTGAVTLNGVVEGVLAPGNYSNKVTYDILDPTSISGKFTSFTAPGFTGTLTYTPTDVLLNLTAALGSGASLNQNQQSVANSLNSFFNNGGTLPASFLPVFGLTGPSLGNALSRLDGEDATGAEHAAFNLMNGFLGLMLDPFVYGRDGGNIGSGGAAMGFAPDQQATLPPDIALAYADALKAPSPTFAQRWTAWGAGFGGSATANGDTAVGSNNVTTSTYGYAAGMDYHYSPDTVLGFALAGGGTNWNLAQGLGTGRSDAVQAGLYGVTHEGPAYVAAALAFANNWFSTNRTAFAGDQLSASFQGQSYGARLEGGYRFAVPYSRGLVGITPYAAIQAQDFHTPSYSETDLTGGGFGLTYNAMTGTDTRSELGSRFDDMTALGAMPLLLRAKLAWAHDWVSNPALGASFESLPGTGFTVMGAPIPHDSALASAGAQLWFTPNWSFIAKFDGEFASTAQTYAGSGTLRYSW